MPIKKGLTQEETIALAEANGWKHNAHAEEDADETYPYEDKTKAAHRHALQVYTDWHIGLEQKKCKSQGLPPPSETEIRQRMLGKDVPLPDRVTLKDFARFYALSRPGKLSTRPTATSIKSFMEKFFVAFMVETGTVIDRNKRIELYRWIRHKLTKEGTVENIKNPKHNFVAQDLENVLTALWTHDDLAYIPERYRIQFTFILLVYCWTGARIGAFFKGGLRWKDITIALKRTPGKDDKKWTALYKLDQRYVKNNPDPENIYYASATKENEFLMFNDTAFLLVLAVADGVVRGIDSLEDLWGQSMPEHETHRELGFHEWAQDKYVIRRCTLAGGIDDKPMPKSQFISIFQNTLRSAGYTCGPKVHAIRRALGKKVDEMYTGAQRSQHLTQSDIRVFGQSYVANCSSVDGNAAFLGRARDDTVTEYFQSLERFREPGLPAKLPTAEREALERDPELCQLAKGVRICQASKSTDTALREAQIALRRYRSKLETTSLKEYQQKWIQQQRHLRVASKGKEGFALASTDRTGIMWSLIPERGRIAASVVSGRKAFAQELQLIMQDMVALCGPPSVTYLPEMTPTNGRCPVGSCGLQLDTLKKGQRNEHVLGCKRRELADKNNHLLYNVYYCYTCFSWTLGYDNWEVHCQTHMTKLSSLVCGCMTYCHTTVRPACCPFCLGSEKLPAAKRLASFSRDSILWTHMEKFHLLGATFPSGCPHPLCGTTLDTSRDFRGHLIDVHGLSAREPKPKSLDGREPSKKRGKLEREADGITWTTALDSLGPELKRYKATSMTSDLAIDDSSVIPTESLTPTIAGAQSGSPQRVHDVSPERLLKPEECTLSESSTPASSYATSIEETDGQWDKFFNFPPTPEPLLVTEHELTDTADGQTAYISLEDQQLPTSSQAHADEPLFATPSELSDLGAGSCSPHYHPLRQIQKRCSDQSESEVLSFGRPTSRVLDRAITVRQEGGRTILRLQCLPTKPASTKKPAKRVSRPAQSAQSKTRTRKRTTK